MNRGVVKQFEVRNHRLLVTIVKKTDLDERSWVGAIVRINPAGVGGEIVADVEAMLRKEGAVAVKVMPAPRTTVVLESAKRKAEERPRAREVVLKMVADANSADRERLSDLVEAAMAKHGV